MVTEYAKYGSLGDLIFKSMRDKPPTLKLRIKMCLDASKGLQYLHYNGVLHRDIKPDNFLVFDLERTDFDIVNAKLTDFGSSRNVNLLVTNMTFTKGIGTPIYMAPEVLKQEHYKMPADVYSLAVTMYEILNWVEAYPTNDPRFKFAWNVAEYIMSGNRLERPSTMNEELCEVVNGSWCENPKERFTIEEIQFRLQGEYNKVK